MFEAKGLRTMSFGGDLLSRFVFGKEYLIECGRLTLDGGYDFGVAIAVGDQVSG